MSVMSCCNECGRDGLRGYCNDHDEKQILIGDSNVIGLCLVLIMNLMLSNWLACLCPNDEG